MWLGAAAALSGAGTLAYLLVRSSQRGRGDGKPGKASETHTAKGSEDFEDTSIRKNVSYERLNGHLLTEGRADGVCETPDSADCTEEANLQNLSEKTLTPGEICDVNASVEQLSNNLDENLSELVSAIQEKIVVKNNNESNTSICEEVNVKVHANDREISQPLTVEDTAASIAHTHGRHQQDAVPGPGKGGETRELIGTDTIEEKKMVSSMKEYPINSSVQETVCDDKDFSSLEGMTCVSKTTETSPSLPEPVVEELSQCLILKPQCDPCCGEDLNESCHHTPATVSPKLSEFSNENVTFDTENTTQTLTQTEDPGMPPESHYTLMLKSSQEDFCISGKHLHDPSPTEAPLAETFIEGQEEGAMLNKGEPETCIVTVEQRENVAEKQIPPSPLASSQEECHVNESFHSECSASSQKDCSGESEAKERITSDNPKESTLLETGEKVIESSGNAVLETPTLVQEQRSIEKDATQDQGQSDNRQEVAPEQNIATEQEKDIDGQEHNSSTKLVPEKEQQNNEQEVPQEQKMNAIEQEGCSEGQKDSSEELLDLKEEEQRCSEQKQDHDKEKKGAQMHKQTKGKQSSSVQEGTLKQEQNDNKQEAISKQKQSSGKQETKTSEKKQMEITPNQEQENNKQSKAKVEQMQTNSNRQTVSTTQEQEQKEETQKQEGGDKDQKVTKKEQQSIQKKEMQKQKEDGKNQNIGTEEQNTPREETLNQREGNKKQKVTKKEEQSTSKEGKQNQKESNKKQKVTQKEAAKSSHKQDAGKEEKEETDNKPRETQRAEQAKQKKEGTSTEQSAKDQVTANQTALSPSRHSNSNSDSGGKKGSVRSRGDSASADLDCDLSSEQDNLNCDSSSLVNR